jgi:hypothetical protein
VRDALALATRNGADAVGMADRIGTLTPGKRADITFISSKRFLITSAFPLALPFCTLPRRMSIPSWSTGSFESVVAS